MKKAIYAAFCLVSLSAFVLGLLAADTRSAEANGAPVKIILTYLPNVSNWGPTNATGVAEVVRREGQVNLNIVGLTSLADETYTGWLVNTGTNETMNVGQFNTDQSGVVKTTLEVPTEFPDKGWNMFLVTVEAKGPAATAPGQRKSIAGYYPDSVQGKQAPAQLPQTGGDASPNSAVTNPSEAKSNPPAAPATSEKSSSRFDSGNSLLVYGAIVVAALGLGVFTRTRTRRR